MRYPRGAGVGVFALPDRCYAMALLGDDTDAGLQELHARRRELRRRADQERNPEHRQHRQQTRAGPV